ncbi:phage terminase large subunit-like protein [Bosea sp. OAE752]|uniref:terminase large subunit domain-containing protein n=1 Tax=Bosea sp. OAE752 TaxID=2663873 RepID=UPI003D21882F
MDWSFAQPDWEQTLLAGRSLVPLLPLDAIEAERAAAIFNRLHLPDVPGQPTLGDAAGDWFRDIVRAIFGSLIGGIRMVPGVFVLVPKKNSKTTNGAALMLTALLMNDRPRAAFALFGPTQEIADIAFAAVAGMIDADPDLAKLLHVRDHLKTVVNRVTQATLKVMTFDPKVATGGKFAGWLLDEMHLLGKVSYAQRVIGQLRGASVAVPESFGVIITTQSDEPPAGAFKTELDYARGVRDGRIAEGSILPVLYEFPEALQVAADKPWRKVENWPLVLPNIGRSVSLPVLERDYATAKEKGEEEERRWASQHLNIEIGLALHSNRWEGADHWERAGSKAATIEFILAECEVCTIGIDGGGLDDLLGLAVLGRHRVTKRWYHWGHAWADRGVKLLRKEIAPRLEDFERDGDLTFVDIAETADGANADVRGVADIVERIFKAGLLPEKAGIGVDAVGIAAILDELALREIPDDCIAAVPQGYRLSGVIKGAARKLKDGTLKHGARPMMAWCVGNCRSELRGSAVLVTKQASGTAKIDPMIALFNAFDLMSRNPEAAGGPSVYETRGVLMV